jgi:hypothetical protein
MESVAPNYLFYAIVAVIAILIITTIIKKAFKLLLLIIIIIIGISAYNVFVKGVSPTDEVKSYSTDIKYGIAIKDYSSKVKSSVNNLKMATEGSIDKDDINIIIKENENLNKYQEEVQALEHSSKVNFFHDKYCDYLNAIASTSDGVAKISKLGDNKNIVQINDMVKKLSNSLNGLSELKME